MSSLQFYFHWDNQIVPLTDLGMDDLIAVEECVRGILDIACPNLEAERYFFRIESLVESLFDEDEPDEETFDSGIQYGLVRCRSFDDDSEQVPEYIPPHILNALVGKKIKIHPHSTDTQNWGQETFIVFASKPGGLPPLAAAGAPSVV